MSINRYAAKVDSNQADIVEALKACGCDVEVIRRPVDLAVGRAGKTYLLEVKRPKGGKKTPAQEEFFEKWRGHAAIVTTPEEALMAVGLRGGGGMTGKVLRGWGAIELHSGQSRMTLLRKGYPIRKESGGSVWADPVEMDEHRKKISAQMCSNLSISAQMCEPP